MSSLERRLAIAEKRAKRLGGGRDRRLLAAFRSGDFTADHLDQLYEIVQAPLLAAVLVSAAGWRPSRYHIIRGAFDDDPLAPMTQIAALVAFLSDDEVTDDVAGARRVLTLSDTHRNASLPVEHDTAQRGRRGLLQRLVAEHGLDHLRAAVPAHPGELSAERSSVYNVEEWQQLLPPVTREESTRLRHLHEPFHVRGDMPLLYWRDETGQVQIPEVDITGHRRTPM